MGVELVGGTVCKLMLPFEGRWLCAEAGQQQRAEAGRRGPPNQSNHRQWATSKRQRQQWNRLQPDRPM